MARCWTLGAIESSSLGGDLIIGSQSLFPLDSSPLCYAQELLDANRRRYASVGIPIRPRLLHPSASGNVVEQPIVPAAEEPVPAEEEGPTKTQILYLRTTHVQQGVLQLHKVRFLVRYCVHETKETKRFCL